jgi:integrase
MPSAPHTNKPKKRRPRNLKRLTEENVLTLEVKRRQYMVWDSGRRSARGLGILISPTGTRSYRVVYYFPGSSKPHSMRLGRVGELPLAEARKRAADARGKAQDEGIDPKAANASKSDSFKSAVEEYVRHWQKGKRENATAEEVQRILLKACSDPEATKREGEPSGGWLNRPVGTIRAQEIDKLLCSIRDGDDNGTRPKRYLANKVHALLRTFFDWCAKPAIGKIRVSPMVGVDKPFDGEKPRDRHFSDGEIKAIWRAANKIGGVEGRFIKALLLTGKRKGALSRMRWEHINEAWFWEPPQSESRKNKRLLPVPLSALTQSVIGKRQAQGYVFPGVVESTHYVDDGVLHRKVRRESGIANFFPHALRHTAETKLAELRVPPHIRDLLFDHQPMRGSGARYDHHSYGDEMREAIEKWAAHVAHLVQPKLVAEKQ